MLRVSSALTSPDPGGAGDLAGGGKQGDAAKHAGDQKTGLGQTPAQIIPNPCHGDDQRACHQRGCRDDFNKAVFEPRIKAQAIATM